ncbi:hypothetical protein BX666DRAFT_2121514 [Dichotomocladium elegans]|nr:hypothetical protein BX666DRAFT_2121514 [Dichotomocladium elegans]
MPTLIETVDTQNQLAYAELLFTQIQNDNARLIEERDILRRGLEASQSELMLAMSAVANEEAAHHYMEQVSETKHTENQNLLAQVATTRKKLSASRDRNKILCRQSRRLNSKLTEEISKHQRSEMSELQDKNAIWFLENQVNGLVGQSGQMSKELQDIQEKNRQLEESYREITYNLTSVKDAIARENETLRSRITELLQQAKDSSSRADMATRRFEKSRQERHRLRYQLNKMRAVYKSSVNTYKMSAASSNEELKQVKAALEETKLTARDTQEYLQDELDILKRTYTDCQGRLHVVFNRLQSISKDPSVFEASKVRDECVTTQAELPTEKDWDEMYHYFSELRKKYVKSLLKNKDMKTMNNELVKEAYSLQAVKACNAELQMETASLHEQVSHLTAVNQHSEEKIEKLQKQVSTFTHRNEELDRSLRSTTYQLRYLIRDAQNRNKTPPPEVDGRDTLSTQSSTTPTEAHEKIVSRDVDKLQRRNQELLNLAAQRRRELKSQIIELDQPKRSNHHLEEQLSKERESYNDKVDSLTRQIKTLEARTQEATNERDTLRKAAEDHVRMTSPAVNLELQRENEQTKRPATQLDEEVSRLAIRLHSIKLTPTRISDQADVDQELRADLTTEKDARSDIHGEKRAIEAQLEQQQRSYDVLKTEYDAMKAGEKKLQRLIQTEHDDAWDKRCTMDELITRLEQKILRQISEIAQYKCILEQMHQSSENKLLVMKHQYDNLAKELENVKFENAELLKNAGGPHATDTDMSGDVDQQDLTTQLIEQLKRTVEQGQEQHADDRNTIDSLERKISELNSELGNIRTTAFHTEGRLKNAEFQLTKGKKQWASIGATLQKNLASTKEHFSKLTRIHQDTLTSLTEKQLSGMPSDPSAFLELARRTTVQLRETLSTFTAENSHCYSRWKAALDPSERDKKYWEDIDKNMKRMHEETEFLRRENCELEAKYASMLTTSAVSDNQLQNEKLQRLCDDLENQTKTLSTQLFTKQTELEECHARINSLEADVKRHSDTTQQLKCSVQDWSTRPLGLLSMLNIQRPDLTESPAVLKENQPPKASLVTTQDERPTANAKTGERSKMKEVLTELNKIKRQRDNEPWPLR